MAPVVDASLLALSGQRLAALCAPKQPPKEEVVLPGGGPALAVETILYSVEENSRDQGLVRSGEGLSGRADPDRPCIERVVEHQRHCVLAQRFAVGPVKSTTRHLASKVVERVVPRVVQLKRLTNDRTLLGVYRLDPAPAVVAIADGCWQRQKTLLEPAVEALARFLAEIADVVGCYDGLDVSRQASAAGQKIQALVCEVNLDSGVDELSKRCPISEVPRAAVDLVDQHAVGIALLQLTEHPREHRSPALRRGHRLLEPLGDPEILRVGEPLNRRALFLKRDAFPLFRGRNASIGEIRFHNFESVSLANNVRHYSSYAGGSLCQ